MFTGIVETTARILSKDRHGIVLERPVSFDDLAVGNSIAVAGVCLSIVAFDDTSMRFQIVKETWDRTSLGTYEEGERINVERSLSALGRFEGHVVQGHVEGVAEVMSVRDVEPLEKEITLRIPEHLLPCVVPKGAIALDGVSLTIATVQDALCTIALIPHTLKITTFGTRDVGDAVNVETDIFIRALFHRDHPEVDRRTVPRKGYLLA